MKAESAATRNRWSNYVKLINDMRIKGGLEAMDAWREISTVQVLETYAKRRAMHESFRGVSEATQASDVSFIRKHGINILAAAMPNLIANDLVSVQPLQARIGEIRFLDVRYGDTRGNITKGETFSSYERLGGPAGKFNYSSNVLEDEVLVLGSDLKTAVLAWTPIIPGSVAIAIGATDYVDNGSGKLLLKSNSTEVGTVNYATGAVVWTTAFGAAPASIKATYKQDNLTTPVEAPEVDLRIRTVAIEAQSRKLKTKMSFDAMYDFQIQYGYDVETESSSLVAGLLQSEIDGELIQDMYDNASSDAVSFNTVVPNAVAKLDHYEGFSSIIIEASNNINLATRFAQANWSVLGINACNVVESLANRGFIASGQVQAGPHHLGVIGNHQYYKNQMFRDKTTFVTGHKGDTPLHAGLVYAPYMPIMTTDLLAYENFEVNQGYSTSYGKKLVNAKLYAKGLITAV